MKRTAGGAGAEQGGPRDRPWAQLLERLAWRGPIRPETLISEDAGLRARTFGVLFTLGGLLALVVLVVGDDAGRKDAVIAAAAATALAVGVICFAAFERLPKGLCRAFTFLGNLLVTTGVFASATGAEGVWALLYFWVVLLAALFFELRFAALQTVLALLGFAAAALLGSTPFALNYIVILTAVLSSSALVIGLLRIRIEQLAERLADQARADPLTGLANRRAFDQRLELETGRSQRSGEPLSIAICDLDHFKLVNDRLGHEGGDEALKRSAAVLTGSVRSVDAVARLGGEEFGVVLPGVAPEQALEVIERIRTGISAEFRDDPVPLTISCGVAGLGRDGEGSTLLRAADTAMYRAKAGGRNRTVLHRNGGPPKADS